MVWERSEELDLNLCGVKFFTQTGKLPRYVRDIFCDQVEKKSQQLQKSPSRLKITSGPNMEFLLNKKTTTYD